MTLRTLAQGAKNPRAPWSFQSLQRSSLEQIHAAQINLNITKKFVGEYLSKPIGNRQRIKKAHGDKSLSLVTLATTKMKTGVIQWLS
jgi:hypothetical protein